nr:alpha/beta hydrolase [Azospirillum cavernae]
MGADFINAGAVGHINVASGFGPWPLGETLVKELMALA